MAHLVRKLIIAAVLLGPQPVLAQQGKAPAAPEKAPPAAAAPAAGPPAMIATPIGEIPVGRPVMILGIVTAGGPAHFTLNDGGAAIIVSAGPGWSTAAGVGEGDRVLVIGQLDRFGSGMFMAGSITTTEGRTVPVKPYK